VHKYTNWDAAKHIHVHTVYSHHHADTHTHAQIHSQMYVCSSGWKAWRALVLRVPQLCGCRSL